MTASESLPRATLERVDALHIGLTQIVLEGGDLSQIAEELSRVLDVGVLVTSSDGRERAAAMPDGPRRRSTTAGLLDPTGRFQVEQAGPDGTPVGAGQVRMLRVVAGGADLARLVCVRDDAPVTPDDVRAMERASAVAALLITPRGGGDRGREQVPRRLPARRLPRPRRRRRLRRGARGRLRLGPAPAAGGGRGRDRPGTSDEDPVSQAHAAALAGAVLLGLAPGHRRHRPGGRRASTSPPRWSRCCRRPGDDHDSAVRRAVHGVAGDKGGGRRSFSVGVSRPVSAIGGAAGGLRPGPAGARGRAPDPRSRLDAPGSTTSGCTG